MDQDESPEAQNPAEPRADHPTHQAVAPGPEPTEPADDSSEPRRPSFVFFGALAALSLIADVLTKAWAEIELLKRSSLDPSIKLIENHLQFTLAYNKGGAWGLFQDASETLRKPFFFVVSIAAIVFIVSLYSRLAAGQRALKWGLPLVLGGALGNLADRVTRGSVVDFIDYRADWVESMNQGIAWLVSGWNVTDHWPTFNVADVSICIGVGLMAVDMIVSRQGPAPAEEEPAQSDTPATLRSGTDAINDAASSGEASSADAGEPEEASDESSEPRVSSAPSTSATG